MICVTIVAIFFITKAINDNKGTDFILMILCTFWCFDFEIVGAGNFHFNQLAATWLEEGIANWTN